MVFEWVVLHMALIGVRHVSALILIGMRNTMHLLAQGLLVLGLLRHLLHVAEFLASLVVGIRIVTRTHPARRGDPDVTRVRYVCDCHLPMRICFLHHVRIVTIEHLLLHVVTHVLLILRILCNLLRNSKLLFPLHIF